MIVAMGEENASQKHLTERIYWLIPSKRGISLKFLTFQAVVITWIASIEED